MVVQSYFLHIPRNHDQTLDKFKSIREPFKKKVWKIQHLCFFLTSSQTCFLSLFYFLKPGENCSARKVSGHPGTVLCGLDHEAVDHAAMGHGQLLEGHPEVVKGHHFLAARKTPTSYAPGSNRPPAHLDRVK